jgi:hypothetical protein
MKIISLLYKMKNSKLDSVKTPQKCHTHLRTSIEIHIIQISHALLAKRWKPDPVGTRQAEEDFFGAACFMAVLVEAAYPNWTAWKTTFEDDDTSPPTAQMKRRLAKITITMNIHSMFSRSAEK